MEDDGALFLIIMLPVLISGIALGMAIATMFLSP